MKVLIILTSGFEDIEALGTMDVLFRAGITVQSGTYDHTLDVTSQAGRKVKADIDMNLITSKETEGYEALVIPGGRAVWQVLQKKSSLFSLIRDFHAKRKLVAAICAAPSLLEMAGILESKTFTCFPGMETGRGKRVDSPVVIDERENVITARSAYYTLAFAEAVTANLAGSDVASAVITKMKGD